jgi:hypothetical protein
MYRVAGNVKLDSDFDTEKIRARITRTDGPGAHGVRPYRLLAKAWAPRREGEDLAPRLGASKHLQQRGSALVLPRAKRRLNRSDECLLAANGFRLRRSRGALLGQLSGGTRSTLDDR